MHYLPDRREITPYRQRRIGKRSIEKKKGGRRWMILNRSRNHLLIGLDSMILDRGEKGGRNKAFDPYGKGKSPWETDVKGEGIFVTTFSC